MFNVTVPKMPSQHTREADQIREFFSKVADGLDWLYVNLTEETEETQETEDTEETAMTGGLGNYPTLSYTFSSEDDEFSEQEPATVADLLDWLIDVCGAAETDAHNIAVSGTITTTYADPEVASEPAPEAGPGVDTVVIHVNGGPALDYAMLSRRVKEELGGAFVKWFTRTTDE
jgi:hypothetical protein